MTTLTTFTASILASCLASLVVSLVVSLTVARFRCRLGAHLPGAEQLWVRREDGYPEAIAQRCERCGHVYVTFDGVKAERCTR